MPNAGTPAWNRSESTRGAPSAYTDCGPPDRMSAFGFRASISSTGVVCGTISEYTFASRTRRAISCAYCAPKSTTRTGLAFVPDAGAGVSGLTGMLSLMAGLRGDGRRGRLAACEVAVHLARDAALGEEGEQGNDAAGGDQQEGRDRPAEERDEHEVDDEVRQVEVPVGDLGGEAEVDAGVAPCGHEGEEAVLATEVGLEAEAVLEDHLEHEDQQHHAGRPGEHTVDRERAADPREVGRTRLGGHALSLRAHA